MAKGSSINRKEMIKAGTLKHQEGRKTHGKQKYRLIDFTSPLELSSYV